MYIFILYYIILLLMIISFIKSESTCSKDLPILKNNSECVLEYCSENDFNKGKCKVNNEIIKTQWLTQIISIGGLKYRYINIVSYPNGDMVLLTTSNPAENTRIFYGINKDGRPFFTNQITKQKEYLHKIEVNQNNSYFHKYEGESSLIKLSGNNANHGKEYFMSASKKESFIEIYDFENNITYQKQLINFTDDCYVQSFRYIFISLISNNKKDFDYLFGYTCRNVYTRLQKHKFEDIKNFENEKTLRNTKRTGYKAHRATAGVSCFQTNRQIIICMLLNETWNYIISAYNIDLEEKYNISFHFDTYKSQNYFYKCIHLKEEIGVFSIYWNITNNLYPVLLLKEFEHNSSILINYTISEIILNKIEVNNDLLLNDIIKINNNKICFLTISNNKEKLYIIIINLFRENKYKIRYYMIEMYKLYKYKFYKEIRGHNYNNFISFGFSFCNEKNCSSRFNNYYSGLIIFSYPNSTDKELSLKEYFIENSTYINLNITLNNGKIENNIFGYIFSGVLIENLIDCELISLNSSFNKERIIPNKTFDIDDTIELEFIAYNNSQHFNCNIQYKYILTQPDLEIYDIYPIILDGANDTNDYPFEKMEYLGRLTYYSILFEESLTGICHSDNCNLCLIENMSFCLNYNDTLSDDINSIVLNTNESDNIDYNYLNSNQSDITKISSSIFINSDIKDNFISDSNEITTNTYKVQNSYLKDILTDIKINSDFINKSISDIIDNYTFSEIESTITEKVVVIGNIEIIKRELNENKEELIEIIPNIIDSIEIGKNYEITGEDFIMTIKPTNISIDNSTYVDFISCENILREYYNISNDRILTFLQLEIDNKNDKSLVNQVGYQVYDDNKTLLDLSLCNDTNIQIFYMIKPNSSLDMPLVSSFKDLDIDLLNINDSFFNDICQPYSNSNNDIILKDRIEDYYQNYSLCDYGCVYNETRIDLNVIVCDCKVNDTLTTNITTDIDTWNYKNIYKSSSFSIINCYNLVFSFNNKKNNIGFWILSALLILHMPFLFAYFLKGIQPIREYLVNEMIENGYIKKKEGNILLNNNEFNENENYTKKHKTFINNNNQFIPNDKRIKHKILSDVNNIKTDINGSSVNRIKYANTKLVDELNNQTNNISIKNKKKKKLKIKNKKVKIKKKKLKDENKSVSPTEGITNNEITNIEQLKNKQNNIINLSLININLKTGESHIKTDSNYVLNVYTFEEASKYDHRQVFHLFYIYLLAKQILFHTFLYKSPLILFPLRFCLLMFIISSDLSLNAIFYFDKYISEKYKKNKNFVSFAFTNNITVILLSTLLGFILLSLFTRLSNTTNDFRNVFRNEEKKIKKDKNYVVTEQRKLEIQNEIELILKKYRIKVILLVVIELMFMIFFWYYVTVFCHVYQSTQLSWLWDSFLSMIFRFIIDALLSLLFAKLYKIAVSSESRCLYSISLFFYLL